MTRHVSADRLASYREGDVSRRRAVRISAHLSGCASCAGVNSDLAAVSSVLAGVRLPGIPDHLAARLQSALATEVTARAALSPGQAAGAGGSDPVTAGADAPAQTPGRPDLPERARHSRRRRTPWPSSPLMLRTLAAAGAVVVVAGGGYLAASRLSSVAGPASTGGGAPGTHMPVRSGAAHSAPQPRSLGLPYHQNGINHTAETVQSTVDFTRATLASQVRRELASSSATYGRDVTQAPIAGTVGSGGQVGGVSVVTLEGCISLVAAGRDVLLVDVARYQGQPATVIVAAKSPSARTLYVFVVSRACSASDSDVISSVTIPAS